MLTVLAIISGLFVALWLFVIVIIIITDAQHTHGSTRNVNIQVNKHTRAPNDCVSAKNSDVMTLRKKLIQGAAESPLQRDGPKPTLDAVCQESLVSLYGSEWFESNKDLLLAMIAYVQDFRALDNDVDGIRQFFPKNAPESCLINIFNCMRLVGAFTQPTIPKQKPAVGDFILAFSGGSFIALSDPQSTAFTLVVATKFASELSRAA